MKFFRNLQKELHTRCNTKKATINGQITKQQLQSALQKYINNNILCVKCGNPETIQNKILLGVKPAVIHVKFNYNA